MTTACARQIHYRVALATLHSALLTPPPAGYAPLTGGPESLLGLLADAESRAVGAVNPQDAGDPINTRVWDSVAASAVEQALLFGGVPDSLLRQINEVLASTVDSRGDYPLELQPAVAALIASGNPIRTRAQYTEALAGCAAPEVPGPSTAEVAAADANAANAAREEAAAAERLRVKQAAVAASPNNERAKAEFLAAKAEFLAAQQRASVAEAEAEALHEEVSGGSGAGAASSSPGTPPSPSTMTMVAIGVGALLIGALIFSGGSKTRTPNPHQEA